MFPLCMENSGQIQADPTLPPDLSHPYFLNNNDDFAKVENGHMGEIVEENSFFFTCFHLKESNSFHVNDDEATLEVSDRGYCAPQTAPAWLKRG